MACDKTQFYESVTVGERGQIVIPAEARADMNFQPGEKLLVLKHPVHQGLVVFKIGALQGFMDELQRTLDMAQEIADEDTA
ncbi:MAG: AbrB/MazE/SpoVT family DNA-binding domain-containing protein [Fimbriimonadaceae bacterium]